MLNLMPKSDTKDQDAFNMEYLGKENSVPYILFLACCISCFLDYGISCFLAYGMSCFLAYDVLCFIAHGISYFLAYGISCL